MKKKLVVGSWKWLGRRRRGTGGGSRRLEKIEKSF